MMTSEDAFPSSIPCEWSGPPLPMRFKVPRIWTQRDSRAFAVYWSEKLAYGRLYPTPTAEELNNFYGIEDYKAYLNPPLTRKPDGSTPHIRRGLFDRVLTRLAWWMEHAQSDPEAMIRRLVTGPDMTVCDIGCGSCNFLASMEAAGFKAVGVDPSDSSRQAAANRSIEFFSGVAEHIPDGLRKRKFKVVTMFHSLEHCTDPKAALDNVRSLLADGGWACIEVPNHDCIGFEIYGPSWYHTDAGRHLYFFTRRSLEMALREAGLRAEHWEFDMFTRQFSKEWLAEMQNVWDRMHESRTPEFPRPADWDRFAQFVRSLGASASRRYDAVRFMQRMPTAETEVRLLF